MEIDLALVKEITSFANSTGAYCIVRNSDTGEKEYELYPVGHISFVYDKSNGNKPTCFLFSMELEQTGGALRRIVLTGIEKRTEKSYTVYGYMGGVEVPVAASILKLGIGDKRLEEANWHELHNKKGMFRYLDEVPDWEKM